MERPGDLQRVARSRALAVDTAVGFGLCTVLLGQLAFDPPLNGLTWRAALVAVLAGTSLVTRRRWPLAALGLAVASGVAAMPVSLEGSSVNGIVGVGLLAVTAVRAGRELDLPGGPRAWASGLWRRARSARWQIPAVTGLAAVAVLLAPADLKESAGIAVLLAACAVGLTTGRRTVVIAGGAAAAALAIGGTVVSSDAWTGANTPVPLIAMALVGVAVGDAVRSRRELVLASDDRTRRMEQALEEEARRRVVEERLRIAREVHDLVAHHIAVVNMQAGVAAHHLRGRPDEAAEALGHVRSASQTVLGELGTLLGVLRDVDKLAEPVEPTPRMADLDRLVESFTAAGLHVESQIDGTPRTLPATLDLTAYRVVQECLTNAHKYGDGTAELRLTYADDWLDVDVRNPCRPGGRSSAEPGTGHGMVGMRERLAAVGGTVTAGSLPDGVFAVTARLPLTAAHTDGPGERMHR